MGATDLFLPETARTAEACRPAEQLAELDAALAQVARYVTKYGDRYWPLFQKLEDARAPLAGREERLRAALARIEG